MLYFMSSCSTVFKSVYGLKDPKPLNKSELIKQADKLDIPESDLYELDKSYLKFIYSKNDLDDDDIKYRTQPLQVMYYDKTGKLLSHHVNCLATGFPKLNWNVDNNFEYFVPESQAPLNQSLPSKQLIKYFKPLNHNNDLNIQDYHYLVIIFYNDFMRKQSKHLIKSVKDNLKLNETNESVKVIYVNNDNFFSNLNNE